MQINLTLKPSIDKDPLTVAGYLEQVTEHLREFDAQADGIAFDIPADTTHLVWEIDAEGNATGREAGVWTVTYS